MLGKMVSQNTSQQDSPVDLWKGFSDDAGDVDAFSSLLNFHQLCDQSDVKLSKHKAAWINPGYVQQELPDLHKAAWINPGYVQQELPDLPTLGPTVEKRRSYIMGDTIPSLLPLGNTSTDTSVSKDTVNSLDSSLTVGAGEKSSEISLTSMEERPELPPMEERPDLPPYSLKMSVSKNLASSTHPEIDNAFPQQTASLDAGAVQVGRRNTCLNAFSLEAFVLPVDIEKENAHFHVADLIISTIEKIKYNILSQWHMENWNLDETSGLLKNDQADSEETFSVNIRQDSGSSASPDSGYEGCAALQISPIVESSTPHETVKENCKCDFDTFIIPELEKFGSATKTYGCPYISSQSVVYASSFNSPERIATELYQVFRKSCMLAAVNYQLPASLDTPDSTVVNNECVQKDFESGAEVVQEIKFKSKMRETEDWLPPRFQIIYNVHPPLKRDLALVAQDFLCAGCGTPVEPKSVKRLRYCEYLGKYFCHGCHTAAEACIPARILTSWDFRKYHVSNFSRRLLESIWHQPIFNLLSVGHSLSGKVRELDRVKEIQEQLFHVKKLLRTCRFAESTLQVFKQVPSHLTDECHLFSLDDLVRIKKGLLVPLLKDVLRASLAHVARCELCQGKGFICEFCRNPAVIFPFQTATCRRCSVCRACFHKQCFRAAQCPRCERNTARRRLLENVSTAAT